MKREGGESWFLIFFSSTSLTLSSTIKRCVLENKLTMKEIRMMLVPSLLFPKWNHQRLDPTILSLWEYFFHAVVLLVNLKFCLASLQMIDFL